MRLFVAVELPSDVGAWIDAEVIKSLRPQLPGARWVNPDSRHLTLKFIGQVPDALTGGVSTAVEIVAGRHAPFEARLGGVGAFPGLTRARVVWMALEQGAARLAAIADDLRDALSAFAAPDGERMFVPHLTLARLNEPHHLNVEAVSKSKAFAVDALTLYSSSYGQGGPTVHNAITVAALRGGVRTAGQKR